MPALPDPGWMVEEIRHYSLRTWPGGRLEAAWGLPDHEHLRPPPLPFSCISNLSVVKTAINCPEPEGYLGGRRGKVIQMQLLRYREKPIFHEDILLVQP